MRDHLAELEAVIRTGVRDRKESVSEEEGLKCRAKLFWGLS